MGSPVAPENFQEHMKWMKMEDVHAVMATRPLCRNILFSDDQTKLIDCILNMEKPIKTLDKWFLNIADINTALPSDSPLWPGSTPLHLAVMFSANLKNKTKAANLVLKFLSHGASVQVQDSRGATPLHLGFQLELQHIVTILLRNLEKKGQEVVNPLDNENLSHLHIFCTTDDHRNSLARKLLMSKQNLQSSIDAAYKGKSLDKVKPGWTPLHVAVDQLQLSLVELLLQRGASTASKDARGHTAVHLLFGANIETNSLAPNAVKPLAKLLFDAEHWNESLAEGDGLSRLHVAVWFDDVQSVERLLDLGANIEARVDEPEGRDLKKFVGCTPLYVAMIMNRQEIVEVLLRRGADVLAKSHDGKSLLMDALAGYPGEIANAFIRLIRTSDDALRRRVEKELGVTMLHVACYIRDVDMVKEMLKEGVDVNARSHDCADFWAGYTPLHVLVTSKNCRARNEKTRKAIFKALVQNGCDFDLQDSKGKTALQLALSCRDCYYNRSATYGFLSVGADITIVDQSGKSAMSYALQLYSHYTQPNQILIVNDIVCGLMLRTYQMKFVGMDVIELDEALATAALQQHNGIIDFARQREFYDEVRATEKIKVGQRGLTLRSFLYETCAISLYPSLTPVDRSEVRAFFKSLAGRDFPKVCPLIRIQVRKTLTRLPLIDPARDALKSFISPNFPELCVDIILKYLSNSQLKHLIAASVDDTDM